METKPYPEPEVTVPLAVASAAATAPTVQKTVDVVAPSDMQEGYQFFVDLGGGKSAKVQVPPGGVYVGQQFKAIVIEETIRGDHNIPMGRWRDGLCDCCSLGCCHAQCCLTCWCTFCALGQVLSRMKLSWTGSPATSNLSAFKVMFGIQTFILVVSNIIAGGIIAAFQEPPEVGTETDYSGWGNAEDPSWLIIFRIIRFVVQFLAFVLLVVVTTRLRGVIRSKYGIPNKNCGTVEDCCCAFWCSGCTICQMARHTADFHKYPAQCCSENGLSASAPSVV